MATLMRASGRMRSLVALLAAVLAMPALSNPPADPAQLEQHATAAGHRALEFTQGDLASLLDAQKDFTPEGWTDFRSKLEGWLDGKGATTFSSSFAASGPAVDVRRSDGVLFLTIPGVLKHESRNPHGGVSVTRYRAEIDVQLAEASRKVVRLKQRTCGGANTQSSCR